MERTATSEGPAIDNARIMPVALLCVDQDLALSVSPRFAAAASERCTLYYLRFRMRAYIIRSMALCNGQDVMQGSIIFNIRINGGSFV